MINVMKIMHKEYLATWLESSKCSINIDSFRAIASETYLVGKQNPSGNKHDPY